MQHIRRVLAALRKADERYGLIDEGDKILIGVSGGKDSLCLLKALSIYGLFAKKKFKIIPVTIDLGFDGFDATPLVNWCKEMGMDLIVDDSKFVYQVLKDHQTPGKHIPCSICSRMKKAAMASVAKRTGANKVAFAHHKDDAIETLFMNMIHGSRVATFEPKMDLKRAGITFIRPLILASETDLRLMAEEENLPVLKSKCPADGHTEREFTKQFLKDIYKTHPESEKNFEAMLDNYESFKLYFDQLEFENPFDKKYAFHPLVMAKDTFDYLEVSSKHKELGPLCKKGTTHLILRKHKVVGQVNFEWSNSHQVNINKIEILDSYKEDKEDVLRHLMEREERKANPIVFVYLAKDKHLAKKVGFIKKYEPSIETMGYVKKSRR
ncbi:MAG: tRNA 2-thiocytidine biosynthesis TtcA family protein [Bacilli bacterium]|nr:tRNA 2-thiocytidine biosynthesis TtcA family protein [Bacilli bacterium]